MYVSSAMADRFLLDGEEHLDLVTLSVGSGYFLVGVRFRGIELRPDVICRVFGLLWSTYIIWY